MTINDKMVAINDYQKDETHAVRCYRTRSCDGILYPRNYDGKLLLLCPKCSFCLEDYTIIPLVEDIKHAA